MKHLHLNLTLALFFFVMFSSAQSFKNASEYLDFVGKEQQAVTKSTWKYTKAVAHGKSDRSINGKRKALLKSVDKAIAKINKAEGFGDGDFKSKVLRHLTFNKDLLNQDYAKIIDMKAVAEQSYDAMEAYILAQELADKKMEESQQEYEKDLYTFANAHHINIVESDSDLGKKMKISNAVFEHYNDLYLTYFKVYINEIYLWDAIKTNDINAIQQNANALSSAAKEGLGILETKDTYSEDTSIINSTRNVFDFFIEESDLYVPKITEFLIQNEAFITVKNNLEQTPERKRTKEQIDNYNAMVNDINKGAKTYNDINAKLNTKRQNVINALNTTNANFLSKHIPKD